ncbi:MAG: hypothetical protein ACRDN6_04545 [Gaiellaceae bacterium]
MTFTVVQLAPRCGKAGTFRIAGRAGPNRYRFTGRIGKRALPPGTYSLIGRTAGGRVVFRRTIVISPDKRPTAGELRQARLANVCTVEAAPGGDAAVGRPASFFQGVAGLASAGSSSDEETTSATGGSGDAAASATPTGEARESLPTRVGRVLGAESVLTEGALGWIRLFLFMWLGVAIMLLAVAALPYRAVPRRAVQTLADRRTQIAMAGGAALMLAAASYIVA